MPVARGEDPCTPVPRRRDPGVQRRNHRVAVGYGQCPAWAEVVLHVNQQQRVADRQLDSHTYLWAAGLRAMFRIARSVPGRRNPRGGDGWGRWIRTTASRSRAVRPTTRRYPKIRPSRAGFNPTTRADPNSISPACGGRRFDIIRARILATNPLYPRSTYCLDLASDAPTSPPHHNPAPGATMSP